ncbi:flavin-containing monooxygenase [Tenacibaculum soleae]|uniref:flavin-containing monooxygenase n=1 Tax=Tenacibaculum soleae TaxID=447689 RepID=UPI002301D083|nr:NAD(P)/FAD-dependent oxidoreductase [Tenacibaculum soleae]
MNQNYTDVLIIGAGLSGIGAACHLSRKNADKSYRILEMREELGGTWSLFKYPGIRSDSDMYTFGYSFKTWNASKSFADATSILSYLNEAVDEYKVRDKISYNQKVTSVNFDTKSALWTVTTEHQKTKETHQYTSRFLFSCSGYYNYKQGYTPKFDGIANFKGAVIHPQKWPENLDYTGKKVIVIGSGATAVTLLPAMADKTEHITMVQRSPTYIGALPNKDKVANGIKKILPKKIAHKVVRLKNILFSILFYNVSQRFPNFMRNFIIKGAKKQLNGFPVEPHFTPSYNPWDQRFCVAPDGDLFKVIRNKKASIVTDHIDCFTEKGLRLKSGKELEADIIVTATGLELVAFGDAKVSINNTPFNPTEKLTYKGLMLNDLPNFIFFVGYTNASWTLKSDLTSEYASRVISYMDKKGFKTIVPKVENENIETVPLINLNSGYIHRSNANLPKQGSKFPWKLYQNWIYDYFTLRVKSIKDDVLKFY